MALLLDDGIPIVDMSALCGGASAAAETYVATQIGAACKSCGFFYVVGHGISAGLPMRLQRSSRAFFARDLAWKQNFRMSARGRGATGYVPLRAETTSGVADYKESFFFSPRSSGAGSATPAGLFWDRNVFPGPRGFDGVIKDYVDAVYGVARELVRCISLSLGKPAEYLAATYGVNPTMTLRIINYPGVEDPSDAVAGAPWGVGEHTDYGMLTVLLQDDAGGLEVRTRSGWMQAKPIPESLICNIGDMLDYVTNGYYASTIHRVRVTAPGLNRMSFPFFFDPSWESILMPVNERLIGDLVVKERWDHRTLEQLGKVTFGEYMKEKVDNMLRAVQ